MNLLTFAHKGEAKAFLSGQPYSLLKKNVYKSKNDYLIITGEGMEKSSNSLRLFLTDYHLEISDIINFGTAGAISNNIKIYHIYQVNRILKEIRTSDTQTEESISNTYELKCTSNLDSVACISAKERVLSDEYNLELKKFNAQIVDMELWGLADTAKEFDIAISSYKAISDFAHKDISPKEIKEISSKLSKKLFETYKKKYF